MPGSTTVWGAPYPVLGDAADIGAAVKPLADRLEALLTLIKAGDPATIEGIPIGVPLPYTGSVLPNVTGGPVWAWADGSLVDKTTNATYFFPREFSAPPLFSADTASPFSSNW